MGKSSVHLQSAPWIPSTNFIMMIKVFLSLSLVLSAAIAAPLYGDDGGYAGQASYVAPKQQLTSSKRVPFSSEGGSSGGSDLKLTGGRNDVLRTRVRQIPKVSSSEDPDVVPKNYDVLQYTPTYQHGYGNNKISYDGPSSPYAHVTLYGQGNRGYKMADAYQNQHIDSHSDKEHDYKDDYISFPQPYEYGYQLKDESGNEQHRKESSDGHGNVQGSYGFKDEHGLYRSVEYVADKGGFRASVKTNEPGTENQNPADVHIDAEPESSKY